MCSIRLKISASPSRQAHELCRGPPLILHTQEEAGPADGQDAPAPRLRGHPVASPPADRCPPGYIQHSEMETAVLSELIARRYESGSLLITSNHPFIDGDASSPARS